MSDTQENAEALFSLFHALPIPVDEIGYEDDRHSEVETMILRAGRVFVKQPYTYTDCFVIRYPRRRYFSTSPTGAVRVLDGRRLEEKRKQYFGIAYGRLLRYLTPKVEEEFSYATVRCGICGECTGCECASKPIPPKLTYTYADMRCFAPCFEQLQGHDCPCLVRARREAGRVSQ